MTYEQLYIDGVLMDTDDKTQIMLEYKSNLLADISKLASNKTYTIHLPKTVHNLTVLGHADRLQTGGMWPYIFHSARYFRNGVELIKDGRAALLSAADDLEIAIVWGLSSPFAKLKDGDKKLNDLSASDVIRWDVSNPLDTPTAFFARGYGYCGYSPWLNADEDEGWQGVDITENGGTLATYTVQSGYIKTGRMVGDVVLMTPEPRANWGYLAIPFWIGCLAIMNRVQGGTADDRLWAVLDDNDKVIQIAPPSDGENHSVTVSALTNAATLLININLAESEQNYITFRSLTPPMTPSQFGGTGKYAKFIHPSVSVRWLLDQISAETDVNCNWSGDALSFVDSLAIPLIKRKANYTSESLIANVAINPKNDLGGLSMVVQDENEIISEARGTATNKLTITRDCGVQMDVQGYWSWDASNAQSTSATTTNYGGVAQTSYQYLYFVNYIEMKVSHADNSDDDTYIIGRATAATAHGIDQDQYLQGGRFYHIIAGYGHIDLKQGDEITFELKNTKGKLQDIQFASGQINIAVDSSEDVLRGNDFPIVYNLPEIKIVDFVKFLAAITGTFPLQSSSDDVSFVPIAQIWANMGNALDWTRKVIPSYNNDKPKQLDFKLSDWAQKNWYRWAEDDKVIGNYDGVIEIADETLDQTRDVITFPFAASDGNSIPTYERAKASGTFGGSAITDNIVYEEPQYNECKPRIMVVGEDGNGKAVLSFNGLNMQTIIEDKYAQLAASMQAAKVVKENVKLSNVEILNFDETKPVFLQQYGSYFAVLEIKAADNGVAEVTMLKIK